jgi:hypothetical protein
MIVSFVFREALDTGDFSRVQDLMNANFDLRRQLYGDEILGSENIRMITLGRQVSSHLENVAKLGPKKNCCVAFKGKKSGGSVGRSDFYFCYFYFFI